MKNLSLQASYRPSKGTQVRYVSASAFDSNCIEASAEVVETAAYNSTLVLLDLMLSVPKFVGIVFHVHFVAVMWLSACDE
jgi:hypothetical protein